MYDNGRMGFPRYLSGPLPYKREENVSSVSLNRTFLSIPGECGLKTTFS